MNHSIKIYNRAVDLSFGSRPKAQREKTSKNIFAGILQNNGGEEQGVRPGVGIQSDNILLSSPQSPSSPPPPPSPSSSPPPPPPAIFCTDDIFYQECFRVFSKDQDGCIPADEIK